MSEHRKQRVTVGDLLEVQALDLPSIVENPRQIIDESDRQLDCDRRAVDDARLLSEAELLAAVREQVDDTDLAKPADPHLTETLDLTGPGIGETRRRTIYVASSWRNEHQPHVVELLRAAGHEVYDFRHPAPGDSGFSWSSLTGPGYDDMVPPSFWRPADLALALRHPVARRAHGLDQAALDAATACVLLLPCGSSAHLEAGYCAGRGVPTIVYAPTSLREPELMYLTFGPEPIVTTEAELLAWLDDLAPAAGDLGGES